MKLSSYPMVGFGTSRIYSSLKLGHRFMQQKNLEKLAYQECCISNSLQQILSQKG
jgi:hypothetical protein